MSNRFEHTVPQIGYVTIDLYSPAAEIYSRLKNAGEIRRLNKLRHLGALSGTALVGARLARWDYTIALLYYSAQFNIPSFNSEFKIGRVKFSSAIAALQCASLVWNIGHLPGTFSVEKGVCRFLRRNAKDSPANILKWPFDGSVEIERIKKEASVLLLKNDYYALCRILAVIKLLSICTNEGDSLYTFTVDFAAPLLLDYEKSYSRQWQKIRRCFTTVRHLSYLTLDLPFSGHRWAPNIPDLLSHYIREHQDNVDDLHDKISELLSPIEKNIFDSMYHADRSRIETAIYADLADQELSKATDAAERITKWLTAGLSNELKLGRKPSAGKIKRCLDIRLRSHFSIHPDSCSEIEANLQSKGFSHSAVFKYNSWNSDVLLEPDELLVDILLDRQPTSKDIGKATHWFLNEFENFQVKPTDTFQMLRKGAIESSYLQIIRKVVETHYEGVIVKLVPWDLNNFGIFPDYKLPVNGGAIWAASAKLDDPITQHLLRDRQKQIPPELRDRYAELLGIKAVRDELRKAWKKSTPRCRWLIITASVQFWKNDQPLIEYDGGLLRISARDGNLIWYGIETKNGREKPLKALKRKLATLQVQAETKLINNKFAYAKIIM